MTRLGMPELTVVAAISFIALVIVIWPAARICRRAGYPSWLGVLATVPIANVVLLWFIAFADWPALRVNR